MLDVLNITALLSQQGARLWLVAPLLAALAMGCGSRSRSKKAPRPTDAAPVSAAIAATPSHPHAMRLTERPENPPASRLPYGGTLRVHLEADPPHLNPLMDGHQAIQRVVMGLVYETLVECRDGEVLPGLAEAWERSADRMRLLLRLRSEARWHDGRPVSPMDVQASFEALLKARTRRPALRALLTDVEAVEVLPDRVVRLRLRRPSELVLLALCEVPIVPGELQRTVPLAQLGRQPLGTGPFRFAAWERQKRIRLVRHPPRGSPGARGRPYLDEIVFEVDTDGARALTRTRQGQLDVLPRVLDVHYPDQVAPGALRDTLQLYRLAPDRYSFLAVNHGRTPLGDVRFRRALSLLWPRERLAREVHRGLARPIGGPTFGVAPTPPFDHKAAVQALDGAGYRDTNADGVRDRDGAPIRLTLLQPTGVRDMATESRAFALSLRKAGILLDVVPLDSAALLARVRRGDFDLAPMLWEGRPDEDPRALFGPQGELDFIGYHSATLESLFEQLRLAPTRAARAPLLQRISEGLARDQPVIFLYRYDVPALVSRRVHGLAGVGDRFDFRGVWVDP